MAKKKTQILSNHPRLKRITKKAFSVEEYAAKTKLTPAAVRKQIRSGKLAYYKDEGQIFIPAVLKVD